MKRLMDEYKTYKNEPNYSIQIDEKNIRIWNVLLFGAPDTIYEGGIFKSQFEFPKEYPNRPPSFRFLSDMFHPNIYEDGRVCISILHEGVDEYKYEDISERWNPSHSINSVLLSVLAMLSSPNFESPANITASMLWQKNYDEYKYKVYKLIAKT